MKLTVLGCWAPYPRAGGACSGYLLQTGGKNILIDCGNGVLSNLQKHIDYRSLNAVIVSHFHPDHYMDLYCLRHAISGARRINAAVKPIPIYIPQSPEFLFSQISKYSDAFNVLPIEQLAQVKENGITLYQADYGNIRISFAKTDHPVKAFAVRVDAGGSFFYSADTKWNDSLPRFAKNADLCLCEASVIEKDKDYTSVGHLTAKQAGQLAKAAGAKKLIITHFWPEYDTEIIKKEAESGFGRSVIKAFEGLELNLTGL